MSTNSVMGTNKTGKRNRSWPEALKREIVAASFRAGLVGLKGCSALRCECEPSIRLAKALSRRGGCAGGPVGFAIDPRGGYGGTARGRPATIDGGSGDRG